MVAVASGHFHMPGEPCSACISPPEGDDDGLNTYAFKHAGSWIYHRGLRCPLEDATKEDYELYRAADVHSKEPRLLDLDGCSASAIMHIISLSEKIKGKKIKAVIAEIVAEAFSKS